MHLGIPYLAHERPLSGSLGHRGEYYGILPLLAAGLGFFGGFPYRNQNTAETTACGGGGGLLVLSIQQRTRAIIAARVRCHVGEYQQTTAAESGRFRRVLVVVGKSAEKA